MVLFVNNKNKVDNKIKFVILDENKLQFQLIYKIISTNKEIKTVTLIHRNILRCRPHVIFKMKQKYKIW